MKRLSFGRRPRISPTQAHCEEDGGCRWWAVRADGGGAVWSGIEKGRVCVANLDFKAGSVLFEDRAFVHASELPGRCLACCEDHNASHCKKLSQPMSELFCPSDLVGGLDAAADEMCDLDGFNTLDRARCFIQCMLLYRNNPLALDPLRKLTAANIPRCLESVVVARERFPRLLSLEGMTDDDAAQILGALNTNSHELEQIEGSGLFLLACIMEHDCNPNCSFTTFGDEIWLTAIRALEEGERLSIDYGNNFYLPTAERRAELEDIYGFMCDCRACTVLPDRCRAFSCPALTCSNGKVCPHGDGGEDLSSERYLKNWGCLTCGHQCDTAEVKAFLAAEEKLVEALESADTLCLKEIDDFVSEARVIHPTHFAVFWAIESTAKHLSGQSTGPKRGRGVAVEAEAAWDRVMAAVEEALPALHHEKVVYYDALAQARVIAGNIEGAREAYENAYRVSVMVSGADTPPTLDVKSLAERPPTSAKDLIARYSGGSSGSGSASASGSGSIGF